MNRTTTPTPRPYTLREHRAELRELIHEYGLHAQARRSQPVGSPERSIFTDLLYDTADDIREMRRTVRALEQAQNN